MAFRIFGGFALLLLGLHYFPQFSAIPGAVIGVLLCIAGVVLLIGI